MKIIGLTGGIGSGKSTVLNLFEALGAVGFIADKEAKLLMNSNKELISQIKGLLGENAYRNGKLNNKHIASIVFNDKLKLKALNNLVHPLVRKQFQNFVKNTPSKIIIYEAAILFESNNYKNCDFIITVVTDLEKRLERVMRRDGISREQILNRVKNQSDDLSKIKRSDFVIKNNQLNATKLQVKTIFELVSELNKN